MQVVLITTLAGPALTADAGSLVTVDEAFGRALKAAGSARDPKPNELRGGISDAAFMAAITGKPAETEAERAAREVAERGNQLRQDGPTVAEYVERGYSAKTYPPAGYASKSTDEEVAEAIKAEEAAAIAKAKSPESVKAALDRLDPANDEDWTGGGLPAMGRIEDLIGTKAITRAEVTAMFPDFKRPAKDPDASAGGDGAKTDDPATATASASGGAPRTGPRTSNK